MFYFLSCRVNVGSALSAPAQHIPDTRPGSVSPLTVDQRDGAGQVSDEGPNAIQNPIGLILSKCIPGLPPEHLLLALVFLEFEDLRLRFRPYPLGIALECAPHRGKIGTGDPEIIGQILTP